MFIITKGVLEMELLSSETQIYKTVCMMCFQVCGINAYVKDGRLIKVEGMEEHPFSRGVICERGRRMPDWVYAADRLKYPLKRNSSGGFDRISWDQALEEIGQKLLDIKDKHGARAVALSVGSKGAEDFQISAFAQRWRGVFGTPNYFSIEAHCFRSRIMARQLTMGMYPLSDPDHAECIMLWGHNPDASEPPLAARINKLLEQGLKLIVVDPVRIPLAKKGMFLQVRPGTDDILVLAMIHVIISEDLYDKEFIEKYSIGFDELKEHIKEYTPERAATICDIPAQDIAYAARVFAGAKKACIEEAICVLDHHVNAFQFHRAIAILMVITGNMNTPGGWCQNPFMRLPDLRVVDGYAGEMPVGCKDYPIFHGFWGMVSPYGRQWELPEAILEEKPYPIKAFLVNGSNMAAAWPDSDAFVASLKKLDLVVVMDLFMTQTAKLAHYVLPASSNPERLGLAMNYGLTGGISYCLLNRKIIEPIGESWPDWKFFTELGKKMGYESYFPWKTDEELLDFLLEPSGITRNQLDKENPSGMWFGERSYDMSGKIRTPSGKYEIYSQTLADSGYDPLPRYIECHENHLSTPELFKEYPLIALTGYRIKEYIGWQYRNIPQMRHTVKDAQVVIHPLTAKKYDVEEEDVVFVETPQKQIMMKVHITDDMRPGVAGITHGWEEQQNANILTKRYPNDPVTGYPAMKNFACRIRRV